MLFGTADVDALAVGAATIEQFEAEPLVFGGVICFQLTVEMRKRAREAVLPPSLHPTVPPALSIQAWHVAESPWGAFDMLINRVTCRSGVRARGFTSIAIASTKSAVAGLRGVFGFPAVEGSVRFRHSYDGIDLSCQRDGTEVLAVKAIDPEPMGMTDVQYTGSMNLAHTPNGLRLVQLEAHHTATRVDRLRAWVLAFDGAGLGNALFEPAHVVSSSVCEESVTFPPVRFVCRPDELAFSGTEAVA